MGILHPFARNRSTPPTIPPFPYFWSHRFTAMLDKKYNVKLSICVNPKVAEAHYTRFFICVLADMSDDVIFR
jgi:hypothetical protein